MLDTHEQLQEGGTETTSHQGNVIRRLVSNMQREVERPALLCPVFDFLDYDSFCTLISTNFSVKWRVLV